MPVEPGVVSIMLTRILPRAAALLLTGLMTGSLAGVAATAAAAADLSWSVTQAGRGGGYAGYDAGVENAGVLRVYEFVGQDPNHLRRYWRAPWANRHFFPGAEVTPVSGRHEVLPPRRARPAEDYFRYWSTPPGYSELPPARPQPRFAPVPDEPLQK